MNGRRFTTLAGVLVLALLAATLPLFWVPGTVAGASGSALPVPAGHEVPGVSNAIPPVSCPLPPVNTTFGTYSCEQTLYLTELFVILIGVTITFYVYMGADRAELPGESVDPPVTAQEELEQRRQREAEEAERRELGEEEV